MRVAGQFQLAQLKAVRLDTGTEMVVDIPVTALLVSAPVPTLFTVMLATPPVKPALGVRLKLTSRVTWGPWCPGSCSGCHWSW